MCINSYMRNAIHKTSLCMKNRKLVHMGVSCRTAENLRNDSELKKLPRCLVLESQLKFVHDDACKM